MALVDDIHYQIRYYYVGLLNGNIKLNGANVPIRLGYANGNVYVLVQGVSSTGISNKSMTMSTVATQFRIFVKGDNLTGNEADDLAGQLINLVLPKPNVTIIDNDQFEVIATMETVNVPIYGSEGDTTTKILERNIVVEHRVTHKLRQ